MWREPDFQPADSEPDNDHVSSEQVAATLERLLADPRLRMSERNKNFLRFVVEEKLAGRSERIKSYTIAVDVFGRADTFDSSTDPIVRIEATRLRTALAAYYEGPGAKEPLQMVLPKGSYIPDFATRPPAAESPAKYNASRRVSLRLQHLPAWVHTLALTTLLVAFAALAAYLRPDFIPSSAFVGETPIVIIEPVKNLAGNDETKAIAVGLTQSLLSTLSRFSGVRAMRSRAESSGPVLQFAATEISDAPVYSISSSVSLSGDTFRFWWDVTDNRSGETLWSETVDHQRDAPLSEPIEDQIARRIAVQVSEPRGVVRAREKIDTTSRTARGYGCVLQARAFESAAAVGSAAAIRKCLEETIAFAPEYADAWSMLALVYLREQAPLRRFRNTDIDMTAMALEAAQRAASLAPNSELAYHALLAAHFRRGEFLEAEAAGERALELNPNNPEILAAVGMRKFARGKWDEGVDLVRRSMTAGARIRPSAYMVLALDGYRRENYADALENVSKVDTSELPLRGVIKAAAFEGLGRQEEAAAELKALLAKRPNYGRELRGELRALHFADDLSELVISGARSAGLDVY
jgi:tetratricopeptide (TPR) repeat protein/TolB-like protein